jgi:hypothetical protein
MPDFSFLIWIWLSLLAGDAESAPVPKPVDFARDVQPILEKRCQPCHFPGGKMHAKLPFDKPDTIHHLGEKLFTRIKKDDERAVIRAFLAQAK